jgi:alpha-galactosidase
VNLEWRGGGVICAIGWSGQWSLDVARDAGREVALRAGQQTTNLVLHPGESIRTPRTLLVEWRGDDAMEGHNALRRLLLDHYVPRVDGEIALPPVAQCGWFTFNTGNDVTEANQIEMMEPMAGMGFEAYWLDAGWFEGGWPAGAGSWVPKAEAFPQGLKPVGDAAHERGLKFVLWFEPERVNPASRIAKEHPEWVLHTGEGDGLFNLGDPAARRWLTDFLSQCITDFGIDVYRNDFNIDPLRFWQAADSPDRQGMSEIRYIEGLYAMWDDLRARHPGLTIDNCSSGGRRIDLETVSRSYPLWQSDTQCCGKAMPVWDQNQTAGLSPWVPLHAAAVWGFSPYVFRSIATTGANFVADPSKEPLDQEAKDAIEELRRLRPYWLGDYYPLMPVSRDERHWAGWQFDRPDLGEGFAALFRREGSPYSVCEASLRGIDPDATYEVSYGESYELRTETMRGSKLSKLNAEISTAPGSLMFIYRKR